MFCKNCGNEINDTAAFCPKCGAKTGVPVEADDEKKPETVYEQTAIQDKMQFLNHPDNARLKKNIDNNLKSIMIFLVIMLVDSAIGLYCVNLMFFLRLALVIVILVLFNKLKKNLDAQLCRNLLLLSIATLGPFLIFEFYSLKKNILVLDKKYKESN